MAYYTALIAAWNNPAVLPAGVTGTLLSGLTSAQRVAAINAWTVAGPAVPALLAPSRILNAVVPGDLAALTSTQVAFLTLVLSGSDVDASQGSTIRTAIQTLFAGKTTTLQNLAALVAPFDSPPLSWVTAPASIGGAAMNGPLSISELTAAGLS